MHCPDLQFASPDLVFILRDAAVQDKVDGRCSEMMYSKDMGAVVWWVGTRAANSMLLAASDKHDAAQLTVISSACTDLCQGGGCTGRRGCPGWWGTRWPNVRLHVQHALQRDVRSVTFAAAMRLQHSESDPDAPPDFIASSVARASPEVLLLLPMSLLLLGAWACLSGCWEMLTLLLNCERSPTCDATMLTLSTVCCGIV